MKHRVENEGRPARVPEGNRAGSRCFRKALAAMLVAAGLVAGVPAPRPAGAGTLSLRLAPGNILFPDASPDLVPVIGPATLSVQVKATGRPGYPWTLTLVANSDLMSGPDVIPISAISWTATPDPPFASGTLSTVTPTLVGIGIAHINSTVQFDFTLQNSWNYNAGNYTATATFTLSAP